MRRGRPRRPRFSDGGGAVGTALRAPVTAVTPRAELAGAAATAAGQPPAPAAAAAAWAGWQHGGSGSASTRRASSDARLGRRAQGRRAGAAGRGPALHAHRNRIVRLAALVKARRAPARSGRHGAAEGRSPRATVRKAKHPPAARAVGQHRPPSAAAVQRPAGQLVRDGKRAGSAWQLESRRCPAAISRLVHCRRCSTHLEP